MKTRFLLLACCCLLTTACVRQPGFKGPDYAFLRSSYPVVELNGEEIEPAYGLDIPVGEMRAVIVYKTYRHDYICSFSWIAETNTVYEVTSQWNSYPLTLYRWERTNSLWASRLEPADPTDCKRQAAGKEVVAE